ncbi:division/cell wall cluster transcriptional repressor MraZ [Parvibium lacunae]|uniref:Transcriptional regulator MraZ n=1 Tax=Parvibium lacunae TaxID=1888893 RepID=A0A368L242_9BURK|nr:division/cell wall cluster transcriptional repressor MraZ [Parvibium lacunae]RCS57619.1 transcriptional regulator MraZ [Parvibium lacunae]
MFQGRSALAMDGKGRIAVPARHRDVLAAQCEGRLTLTRHPHGCLLVFPRPVWEMNREKIAAWPMSARAWQRLFLGSAVDVEMDGAGRILIAPELREAAALDKDVVLMGMGSHFELWDSRRLQADEMAALEQPMPTVLHELSF